MLERRDADYADERNVYIEKLEMWTTGKEIREARADKDARALIVYFQRTHRYGLPYHDKGWGEMPLPLVEVLDALTSVHDTYIPSGGIF